MKFSTIGIFTCAVGAFFLFSVSTADAMCRGKAQINLKDGSKACVVKVETTELTRSQYIVGGGPSTARKSSSNGGLVVLNFLGEPDTSSLRFKSINQRAKEVCQRYRTDLLAKIDKPGNPFMVAVFTWGNDPKRKFNALSPTFREIYLTKSCWVKKHQ